MAPINPRLHRRKTKALDMANLPDKGMHRPSQPSEKKMAAKLHRTWKTRQFAKLRDFVYEGSLDCDCPACSEEILGFPGRIQSAGPTAPAGLARLASPPKRADLGFAGDLTDRPAVVSLPLADNDGRLRRKSSAWMSHLQSRFNRRLAVDADHETTRRTNACPMVAPIAVETALTTALSRKWLTPTPSNATDSGSSRIARFAT